MMKYPIGIQTFANIRNNGYVYVDKTALIYRLVNRGMFYFLSRPRRFGKSLLVSTLDAYLSGKKELFQGLAIEQLETEWKPYPVLRLDWAGEDYTVEGVFESTLNVTLTQWEKLYGADPSEQTLAQRFAGIIRRACEKTGLQVVVLVDEYDRPLLQTIDNEDLHKHIRNVMKGFYGILKKQDQYIKFGFITGVTKFSHVSIFSDLNNLDDISMSPGYVELCGVTERELHEVFDSSIHELGEANGMSFEETCQKLKAQYDGYHFCENSVGIYNPFSLLNTFEKNTFRSYWYATGTPSYVPMLLQKNDYELTELQGTEVAQGDLMNIDTLYSDPIPVLYQSGYLTIKDYDAEEDLYKLDFPNGEVKDGFMRGLLPCYSSLNESQSRSYISKLTEAIRKGQPDELMQRLQTFFADNDYRVVGKKEIYFQNILYAIFKMLGLKVRVEQTTSYGRIDIVMETKDYVYIMELKYDGSAEEALQQIKDRQYARPYQLDFRQLYMIGVNFSSETRCIEKWIVEKVEK